MNDYLLERLLRERRQEMLAEARRQHLIKMHDRRHSAKQVRLLAVLGKYLVRVGEQLICRYGSCAELSSSYDKQRNYSH